MAVVDETCPEARGGIYYVVAAAIVSPEEALTANIGNVVRGRKNPFHWSDEGPEARQSMLTCIHDLGVVSHVCVHYPTGRRRQEQARAVNLGTLLGKLLREGVDYLMIESRSPRQDSRDKATILDTLRQLGRSGAMTYGWYPKNEPLIWIADAICGAVKDHLLQTDLAPLAQLQRDGNVEELVYLAEPQTQKNA